MLTSRFTGALLGFAVSLKYPLMKVHKI